MRKFLLVILLLLILGSAATYLIFRLRHKPVPTLRGWPAQVSTIAGNGSPLTLADPFGVAVAKDGTVYVTDAGDNDRIVKIAPDGVVTTFATSFNTPSGLAIDDDGNLYVADTGNNSIRKVTPDGVVTTLAGDGTAGYVDGAAAEARFNGPIGVAVDTKGNVYVADTYNDHIRRISLDGFVTTIHAALFDTPSGIAVATDGSLIVADTGNNQLRKIASDGNVVNIDVSRPVGVVATYDNFIYVTELDRSRVIQITPEGSLYTIASQFNQPTGVALGANTNELYVADSGNYLVRKLVHGSQNSASTDDAAPRLTNETLGQQSLIWPLDPQQSPHEVVATVGEVRGSFDSTDSRDHLHSGLDVFGAYNETVRAVRTEKVTSPLPNWGFGSLNEGFRVGVVAYIHMHVGRDKDAKMFDDPRFVPVKQDDKITRVRIKRGTRFKVGDALGTVNRMYHVHMNVGPPGGEINPLSLAPVGFKDEIEPTIESIQLFDEKGTPFKDKQGDRLIVSGNVRIVVDAYDRTNMNPDRRRLGLYKLGYQLLKPDGAPVAEPLITIVFDRLPRSDDATKVAYAEESGITVYGSARTRFLYEVTNTVRDGHAARGTWNTSQLPKGDYVLRIIAADFSGNEAQKARDVNITIR